METDLKSFNYDSKYFNCLEDHWSAVSFPKISGLLEKGLSFAESKITISNILDLGCGNGIYGDILKRHGKDVYGVDISEISVERCIARKIYTSVLKENVTDGLSFKQNFFDVVFSTEVIEHVEDLDLLFAELARLVREGGVLILTTTMYFNSLNSYNRVEANHSFFQMLKAKFDYLLGFFSKRKQREFVLKYCFEKLGGHFHGFHYRQLKSILKQYGFKVVHHDYFYPIDPIQFPFRYTNFPDLLIKPFPKNVLTFFLFIPISLMNKVFRVFKFGANNIFIIAQKTK